MALVLRVALVVGVIYMLSPVQPDGPSGRPQELAAEAARLAAARAMQACSAHPDACARLAAGGAAAAAAVSSGTSAPSSTGSVTPVPRKDAPREVSKP